MLKEYKKVKHIFKHPKLYCYLGFWSSPDFVLKLGQYLIDNQDKKDTFKYKVYNWLHDKFWRTDPCLPIWRHGNTIRVFKKHQVYEYSKNTYIWNDEFSNTLKKMHLSWLQPAYTLPTWLSFYFFNWDMCWKWKYDDVRYEFPPQITLVLFNISLSFFWKQPKSETGYDEMYWEGILNYTYKYLEKLDGKQVDTLSQIIGLSDYCGYWGGCADDKFTWVIQPDYIRNKYFAEQLKKHQDMKEKDIRDRKAKITCPKCGAKMKCDDTKVLTSLPPKYEYTCPKCGEIKYLDEKIETWYL